ncbi:11767_t:CDS:10 [Diversispora eburnea]|uniref:11767_t:CDS:1 n=1 Tax=Diversispora eburnea TaxID=1213867 RepID=A0A9N8WD76_9GLOM|nr:11767_t:CDS:10 [Diversispora eburnea]
MADYSISREVSNLSTLCMPFNLIKIDQNLDSNEPTDLESQTLYQSFYPPENSQLLPSTYEYNSQSLPGTYENSQPLPNTYNSQPLPGTYENSQPLPGIYEHSQPLHENSQTYVNSQSPPGAYENSQSLPGTYNSQPLSTYENSHTYENSQPLPGIYENSQSQSEISSFDSSKNVQPHHELYENNRSPIEAHEDEQSLLETYENAKSLNETYGNQSLLATYEHSLLETYENAHLQPEIFENAQPQPETYETYENPTYENAQPQPVTYNVVQNVQNALPQLETNSFDAIQNEDFKYETDFISLPEQLVAIQNGNVKSEADQDYVDATIDKKFEIESECDVIDLTHDDPEVSSMSNLIKEEESKEVDVIDLTIDDIDSKENLSSNLHKVEIDVKSEEKVKIENEIVAQSSHSGFVAASSLPSSLSLQRGFVAASSSMSTTQPIPQMWQRGGTTHSRDFQELLRLIPLNETKDAPIEEAMHKINAPDGQIDGMTIKLMDHQVLGVSWMVENEQKDNKVKGGILADDMGLGKTVQTIATMVLNQPQQIKSNKVKSTLIVAPTALIHQWKNEILSKTDREMFSIHVYHGSGKARLSQLKKYDVVITTYHTLIRDWPADPDVPRGTLFRINWFRVVLDEAQNIKNMKSRASKACAELNTVHRWCLTGTPIQNHINDLYSYFRFLNVTWYSEWTNFHREISPANSSSMRKVQAILRGICLRRTKDSTLNGKPILQLPEKIVDMVTNEFSEDERQFYDALETKSRIEFNRYLKDGSVLKNYAYILVMLLRLRQACNHPFLTQEDIGDVISKTGTSKPNLENDLAHAKRVLPTKTYDQLIENPSNNECPICFDVIDNGVVTLCGHIFCQECIDSVFQGENHEGSDFEDRRCPICRHVIKSNTEGNEIQNCDGNDNVFANPQTGSFISSTKIDQLLKELAAGQREDPGTKTIVFSQWTSMLNLIEDLLIEAGYKFSRYDGTMDTGARDEAIQQLSHDPDTLIMLVSLKAGGVGLNLTKANRVIMLDCWWNPYRILILQDKKRQLAAGALGEGNARVGRLTVNDLMFLFNQR